MSAFDVLPAIDVRGGRLARMRQGDPETLTSFAGDPFALARSLVAGGARWIHVVDLDAALAGRAANLDLIERIARLPVRVQAAGGLSVADVERALEHGADRAVLGAGALAARSECEALFARRGGRVAVALDVRGDRLMPRGARDPAEPLEPVLDWLAASVGPPGVVVYTDVMRDGAMAGPDRSALSAVADRTGLPVIASGGIRSASDIRDLVALAPAVIGAIVGRALHEGALTLAEALASVTPASATDGKAPRRR